MSRPLHLAGARTAIPSTRGGPAALSTAPGHLGPEARDGPRPDAASPKAAHGLARSCRAPPGNTPSESVLSRRVDLTPASLAPQ